MRTFAARVLFGLVVAASPGLKAAIVDAIPVSVRTGDDVDVAFVPGTVNKIELVDPYRLHSTDRNLYFRFEVPGASQISFLNSLIVTVHVYDDDDTQDEEGVFLFPLPAGPDLFINGFGGFFGFLDSDPNTTFSGEPCLCDALSGIQDNGRFRIRVQRTLGDFLVKQVDVAIDAQVVPEPSSFALIGLGVVGLAFRLRRRH